MTSVYKSEIGSGPLAGRVYASSAIHFDAIDAEAATSLTSAFVTAANAQDQQSGPLQIDASYDHEKRRLGIRVEGSIRATAYVLEAKTELGLPLIGERVAVSTSARVLRLHRVGASIIANHLINAAQNHPQSDLPLRMESPYDEQQQILDVNIVGSTFATTYLLMIIGIQMTQSSKINA